MVGEVKKGRYVYYHCSGYRGKCPERYTREEELKTQFAENLRALSIPGPILDWLQEALLAVDQSERAARAGSAARSGGTRPAQQPARYLIRRSLGLAHRRRDLRQEGGEIRLQQDRLRVRVKELSALPPRCQAVDLRAVTAKAANLFLAQPAVEQRKLLRMVVENADWKGGELRVWFREPFCEFTASADLPSADQEGTALAGAVPEENRVCEELTADRISTGVRFASISR